MRRIHCTSALLTACLALALAGCGSGDEPRSASSDSASEKSPPASTASDTTAAADVDSLEAHLTVRLEQVGDKRSGAGVPVPQRAACDRSLPATCTAKLDCPPADDADEEDRQLCRWLAEGGAAALREPDDEPRACTMQYGGPETATVTGTLFGEPVNVDFSRTDGCEIARWDAAAPLWTGKVPGSSDEPQPCPAPTAEELAGSPDDAVSSSDPSAAGCAEPAPAEGTGPPPDVIDDPPAAFE